jgi:hypothetical protein
VQKFWKGGRAESVNVVYSYVVVMVT